MPHPVHVNESPYCVEPLMVPDENGRLVLAPLVKGTFEFRPDSATASQGRLVLADEPEPICFAGEHWGDPDSSSYRLEPETAFVKPSVDVVLLGTSVPPRDENATEQHVGFRAGPIQKVARIVGDRVWMKRLAGVRISDPAPVGAVPLIAEHAFGGGVSSAVAAKPIYDPKNPVGRGFRIPKGEWEDEVVLPNVELIGAPLKRYGQRVEPALFGFTSPAWEPRVRYAGTFNKKWEQNRKPLLPEDFDRRYFQGAPQDQIVPSLAGDEKVVLSQVGRRERTEFELPGVPPPSVSVWLRGRGQIDLEMKLDTVIVDADRDRVVLLWRQHVALANGPLDLRKLVLEPIMSRTRRGGGSK